MMRRTVVLISALALMLGMVGLPAAADHPDGPLVEPRAFAGNDACEYRIEPPTAGTYVFDVEDTEVTITITRDGDSFGFTSSHLVEEVIAKGGPNYNLYDYTGEGVTHDSGLVAPTNPRTGEPYGLSHISFCFGDTPVTPAGVLDVTKTAEGSWERDVSWELDKTVDPASHSGAPGDTFTSDWQVVATETDSGPTNFVVTGQIEVSWSGEFPVTVQVVDELDDGTVADVDCGEGSDVIEFGDEAGSVTCTYVANPTDASADDNIVELVVLGDPEGDVTGNLTAEVPITWSEELTGDDEVLLEDDRSEHSETIGTSETLDYPEEFTCPGTDSGLYVDGVHQETFTNTATLTGPNTDETATAEVTITCTAEGALAVTKTAEGSYDREVSWELEKTVTPASHTGGPGDTFTSDWQVVATETDSGPTNFSVTGQIEVSWNGVFPVSVQVDDQLDDGTVADVDCGDDGDVIHFPAGDSTVTCDYVANPADAQATLNTAELTVLGDPGGTVTGETTAQAPVTWSENLIGDDSVLLEDDRSGHSETIDTTRTLDYPEEFTCPGSDSGLYVDGVHQETFTNTATLTGPNTDQTATAEVTITCNMVFVGETVTGAGDQWSRIRGAPKTWFEYTVGTDGTHDLIQGRKRNDVGDVTITEHGDGTSTLCFELEDPWQLDPYAGGNVKIQPLDEKPKAYLSPGQYEFHFTESGSDFCVTVDSGEYGYAIHLDAGYWTSG